jgi:hypothetical protein
VSGIVKPILLPAAIVDEMKLQIALHDSGGSSAHHQEHNTVHTASGIVKTILLPAAIVDEMNFHGTPSHHDSSRQQYCFDNT